MHLPKQEETDEEYLDDPIKLFDFEEERVHFGSLGNQRGNNYEYRRPENNLLYESDTKETAEPQDNDNDVKDSIVCPPSSVKLVNCEKYPWYFKKYAHQIFKTKVYDLVSDSDSEVEYVSDNDCFICDDVRHEVNETHDDTIINSSSTVPCKTQADTSLIQTTMKTRDDLQIELALIKKNTSKIDFKRNVGLVGMTIGLKVINKVELGTKTPQESKTKDKDTEPKKMPSDKPDKNALDTLLIEGTNFISNETENSDKNKRNDKKKVEAKVFKKVKPFCLSTISEVIEKTIDKSFEKKLKQKKKPKNKKVKEKSDHNKEATLNYSTTINKSSRNFIRNINEAYKKKIGAFGIEKNKQEMELDKQIEDNNIKYKNNVQNLKKKDKEPTSPILQCSTFQKKHRDVSDDATKELVKASTWFPTEGEPQRIDNFNASENSSKPLKECYKETIKILTQVNDNPNIAEGPIAKATVKTIDYEKISSPNTPIGFQNVSSTISQDNANNMPIQIVSVRSMANLKTTANTSSTDNKSTVASSVKPSQDAPKTPACDLTRVPQFMNRTKQNILRNVSDINNINVINPINNINKLIENTCPEGDALINQYQPRNCPSMVRYSLPRASDTVRPKALQPQFYSHPYLDNFHKLQHCGLGPKFFPTSANCGNPNFRFPPPPEYRYQNPYYISQCPPSYNEWQTTNSIPQRYLKEVPRQQFTCPVSASQASQKNFTTNFDTSQSKNPLQQFISQPTNITPPNFSQTNSSSSTNSAVPKDFIQKKLNNKEQIDKLNISSQLSQLESNKNDLITSKTKMLEVLDSATKQLKRIASEKNVKEIESAAVNEFKRPRLSNSCQALYKTFTQVEQQRGYSAPILPIPTFANILGKATGSNNSTVCQQNSVKNEKKKVVRYNKLSDRSVNRTPIKTKVYARREETKKISLEEYKKRTYCKESKSEICNKKVYINGNDVLMLGNNKLRENVDRFSTEKDLGYDSDSTVIL